MNILFFLTPKEEVAHVEEDDTLRQVVEKLEYHGYSAIPLLALDGKYIGTITEGDLLWEMVVDDNGVFIGIVTRKDVLLYLAAKLRNQ